MSETSVNAETPPKPRWRKIAEKLGVVVIGTPIAWLVGGIGGYVVGLVLAYIWSTPRQPPQDLKAVSDWAAGIGAFGLAAYYLVVVVAAGWSERRQARIKADRIAHYARWRDAGYETDEIPEYGRPISEMVAGKFNSWLAVAAVIACVFVFDVFQHFVGHQYLAAGAVLFGLPTLAYLADGARSEGRSFATTWAIAGAVVLLVFAARATSTSFFHGYANCWTVRTAGEWEIVDCAPDSEPVQSLPGYSSWSESETPGRECVETDTYAGSATRWRCRET